MSSLGSSAIRGVLWNYIGSATLVVVQIAGTAATARLITPAGFGAYAAAQAVAGILGYFAFATIAIAVVRRPQVSRTTVGSAMVLSLASGAAVLAFMWVLAGTWASVWGVPRSADLIRWLGLALFLNSAAGVPLALARRELRFGAVAAAETLTQVAGTALSVGLAIVLRSPTALAAGQAVAGAALLAAALVLSRRQLSLSAARSELWDLLRFSVQLSGLYFGTYLVNTAPTWMISRTFGAVTLGLFSRANLIVGLPLTYLSNGVTKVVFPLFGRVGDDLAKVRTLVGEGIAMMTGFAWPLLAILAGGASVVVDVLLGPRWHAATPMLQLCALAACGFLPCGLLTTAAEGLGWLRIAAMRQITFCVMIAAALAAVRFAGIGVNALLAAVAAAQWVTYLLTLPPFVRRGIVDVNLVLRTNIVHGLAAGGAFAASLACADAFSHSPAYVRVASELCLSLTILLLLLRSGSWFPATRLLGSRLRLGGPDSPDARSRLIEAVVR